MTKRPSAIPFDRPFGCPPDDVIELNLPIPPSVNHAYPTVKTKTGKHQRVKSKECRDWIKQADAWLMTQKTKYVHANIAGPITLRILLPVEMRGDVSNRTKVAEDYLVRRNITPDDRYSRKVSAERSADVATGMCRVVIAWERMA